MMKIKVIKPTTNVIEFQDLVSLMSKELNGFATQTHCILGTDGLFYYSAVVFYKDDAK